MVTILWGVGTQNGYMGRQCGTWQIARLEDIVKLHIVAPLSPSFVSSFLFVCLFCLVFKDRVSLYNSSKLS